MPLHFQAQPTSQGHMQISGDPVVSESSLRHIWQLYQQGQYQRALHLAQEALQSAQKLIPADFKGTIPWNHLNNRAYLRAFHISILAHSAIDQHLQAISLIEQALRLNPPDNQGLRYLLASECLSAKQYERAKSLLTQYIPERPALGYELAWLHLQTHQSAQAIATLRKAWLDEPAIGHRIMKPVQDRPASVAKPTQAGIDADAYAHRWQYDPAAIAFMQWLKAQPIVQNEQKQAKALRLGLYSTNNLLKRTWLLAKQWRLRHRASAGNDQFKPSKTQEHGHA